MFPVVRDRLQDGSERFEADGDVKQMGRVEEVVEVTKQREQEVESDVEKSLNVDTRKFRTMQ